MIFKYNFRVNKKIYIYAVHFSFKEKMRVQAIFLKIIERYKLFKKFFSIFLILNLLIFIFQKSYFCKKIVLLYV